MKEFGGMVGEGDERVGGGEEGCGMGEDKLGRGGKDVVGGKRRELEEGRRGDDRG